MPAEHSSFRDRPRAATKTTALSTLTTALLTALPGQLRQSSGEILTTFAANRGSADALIADMKGCHFAR